MDYPSNPAVGLVNGKFSDGDPANGVAASLDPSGNMNAIMDELLNVITQSGLLPDENNLMQVVVALRRIAAPAGKIIMWPGVTPPLGYIKANGALLLRSAYADLWGFANNSSGNIIDEATWAANQWGSFSTGDLATTFRIPDYTWRVCPRV